MDEMARDRQAEAAAFVRTLDARRFLFEGFEEVRQELLADPDAGITDA
jgi:hypothetical protein